MSYGLEINKGTHNKLQGFRELIEGFIHMQTDDITKNAYDMGTEIIRQSGIMNDVCQDNSPENLSRKENIEELVNGMNDFCAARQEEGNTNISLTDFLSEVSLLTDQDSDKEGDGEKVTLMTVHSAKGLEFRNVFVVGMEENLFPSGMAGDSPRAMEEERRLFYVAITRAEEHCFLSFAKTRFRYGKMEFGTPSRFLRDIDTCFLRLPQEAGLSRQVDEGVQRFRRERQKVQLINPSILPRNLKKVSDAVSPMASASSVASAASGFSNSSAAFGSSGSSAALGSSASSTSSAATKTGTGTPVIVSPGQQIEHERFGLGEVLKVEGNGDNAKATIRFKNAGEKQLLLRFARFKVVSQK